MIVFFLIISLILNILALTAIILLYLRQNRFVSLEKEQKNNIEQMDQLLTIYLAEMREENEAFIKQLHQRETKSVNQEEFQHVQQETSSAQTDKNYAMTTPKKKAAAIYQANQITTKTTEKDDPVAKHEVSVGETIQTLHNEGKSTAEIAKILNKGKKEVELLLKFHQQQ